MIIFPAIDIRAGRCVRLIEGDFSKETVFDSDPVETARRWAGQGAEWLHIVDLDGARTGSPVNAEVIWRIRNALDLPMQVGGAIRSLETAESFLRAGIDRVVIGTSAVRDRDFVVQALSRWTAQIVIGLDARLGLLATNGWIEQSDISAVEVARKLRVVGAGRFIFTDISRDGRLSGPNIDWLRELVQILGWGVIASGGISTRDDVEAVASVGAEGAIIGRALYEDRISFADAVAAGREPIEDKR
jgi:phosphoribosylformimino-5-aminoimidazole carboxamide ribotide isomerase